MHIPKENLDSSSAFMPGAIETQLLQAVHFAWMWLPDDQKTLSNIRRELDRIMDRLFENLDEDNRTFGQQVSHEE